MARLILNAYAAECKGGFISMALCIGGDPAFPSRSVEVQNVADCVAAFEAYKADATASGLKLALSMLIARGDRAPRGFKTLRAAANYETVNV